MNPSFLGDMEPQLIQGMIFRDLPIIPNKIYKPIPWRAERAYLGDRFFSMIYLNARKIYPRPGDVVLENYYQRLPFVKIKDFRGNLRILEKFLPRDILEDHIQPFQRRVYYLSRGKLSRHITF